MGMESLGGSLFAGRPAVVTARTGQVDVFAIGNNGEMYRWWSNGGDFRPTNPATLPHQNVNLLHGGGPCAISGPDGRLHVFAVEQDGHLHYWVGLPQSDGAVNWGSAPAVYPWFLASDSGLAVTADASNVHLFGIKQDGSVLHGTSADRFQTPLPLQGHAGWCTLAAAWTGDRIDVFAMDPQTQGAALRWSLPGGSGQPGPTRLDGPALCGRGFAAVSTTAGQVEVAAITFDGKVCHWSVGAGSASSRQLPLGPWLRGDGQPIAANSWQAPPGLPALVFSTNHLEAWAIAPPSGPFAGGSLLRWRFDGGIWRGPVAVDANLAAGGVGAAAGNGRVDAFAFNSGTDNSLQHWPSGQGASGEVWMNWAAQGADLSHLPTPPASSSASQIRITRPAAHCSPSTLEELVAIVRRAEREGKKVRACGSRWSFTDVAIQGDYQVETSKLNQVLTTSAAGRTAQGVLASALNTSGVSRNLVHVEAGIKVSDLCDYLDHLDQLPAAFPSPMALPTMGGSAGQTLAGILSTNVHGADFDRGPVADMVRAVHLVGPGGVQHWIEPSARITNQATLEQALGTTNIQYHFDDDWFNSVIVSTGALGIIYSVVIEVVPQHYLYQEVSVMPWSGDPLGNDARTALVNNTPFTSRLHVPNDASNPNHPNRCLQIVIDPGGSHQCRMYLRAETAYAGIPVSDDSSGWTKTVTDFAHALAWTMNHDGIGGIGDAAAENLNVGPGLAPAEQAHRAQLTATLVTQLSQTVLPSAPILDIAHKVMAGVDPFANDLRGFALEMAFDATNGNHIAFLDEALPALTRWFQTENLALLGYFSCRFVGRSRAYLSAENRCDRTMTVEVTGLRGMFSTPVILDRLEAIGRYHGGISHWGMARNLTPSDVAGAYPTSTGGDRSAPY